MDKKTFNKITKEVCLEYGFYKKGKYFLMQLEDMSIEMHLSSSLGIKSFDFTIAINELHDISEPLEKRFDVYIEIKMEHTPSVQGYHKHEILFEEYTEEQFREMLTYMLHTYFDGFKKDGLKYIKGNKVESCLNKKATEYINKI